ncbi:MAG: AmmeMemoRadiSam system radical SAM enzyme [Candidatus Electrothrix sp. GW3-4]|uniref:AmmeMemoRadiSam system radical SAM enzyme n=1 Tax=Candidatus Electrothrix sp. GW3-4 TaxID=3126740 RepID=UPI0030D515BA
MKEARLYSRKEDRVVVCALCHHRCRIKPGRRGRCGVRENQEGVLYSLVYGRLVAENIDPVEKKPFYHFLPSSRSYSISTVGCNFFCQHCQNYQISQYPHMYAGAIVGNLRTPAQVVAAAEQGRCQSVSYTYVEPTIFYEFARDCMELAHAQGLANLFVSNGFMTAECSRELAPLLDGINIDIKSFSEEFYQTVCKASLQPVLDTVRLLRELGVWVEVTTLVIPGLNDAAEELAGIASFLKEVDPAIPWHVTGFYPTYKMLDRVPTSVASLRMARQIGLDAGLRFVYQGNVHSGEGESTLCPSCHTELLSRTGFLVQNNRLSDGRCPKCQEVIEGVWCVPQ